VTSPAPLPRQIPFIIANEGCERFSFYGMRNILTPFLVSSMLAYLPSKELREAGAKEVFHTFVIGVYFFPLLGGWLSDRLFGKYHTIFWFSLVYCLGQGCLAAFPHHQQMFYLGLGLVALGSGGIKPLVATFVGDQFDSSNKHRAKIVFDAFYWIINLGSFFASALMPWFLRDFGPRVAFGVPGVLMAVATVVFWSGRKRYVHVPPSPPDPDSFLRVCRTALLGPGPRWGLLLAALGSACALASPLLLGRLDLVPTLCLALVAVLVLGGIGVSLQLERARGRHSDQAVDGVRAVLRVLVLFAFVTPFWSLFDQKASTWILQANAMTKPKWFEPAQMQLLNPALVMLLIPFNNLILFPALRRRGWEATPLRRMTAGIAFAGLAWIVVGGMQLVLDGGTVFSITWQILPYALLTLGEVLVSATGLEFAYSQAPPSMKGVIMAFWSLVVTIGNLWVLLANASIKSPSVTGRIATTGVSVTAFLMFFFAGFALLAALAFGLIARRYRMTDHYRD
jgi:POT family proton-dependent oligopeptide transporter